MNEETPILSELHRRSARPPETERTPYDISRRTDYRIVR
jgi:hypothetical protein